MILFDTCTLLWLASDLDKLPRKVRTKISEHKDQLFISSISAFEIGIKHKRKLLSLPFDPDSWFKKALEHHGIKEIPVDSTILIKASQLPDVHKDPVDRIIIATAMLNNYKILTPDTHIHAYPEVSTMW